MKNESKKTRVRLSKIASTGNPGDKLMLAYYGMTAAEYRAPEMILARGFLDVKHIDDKEIVKRYKDEISAIGELNLKKWKRELAKLKLIEKKDIQTGGEKLQKQYSDQVELVCQLQPVTAKTESEYLMLKHLEKSLWRFAWSAARQWKPESFKRLADAMIMLQKHKFPKSNDAGRRAALVANKGNVAAALENRLFWAGRELPKERQTLKWTENEKRSLCRLKKVLFPAT